MKINISNNSNLDRSFEDMLKSLTLFAKERLSINKTPSILLRSDSENAKETLGKTAYYNPELGEIHVFVDGRHAKDILRSIAHELVHHMQNEKGSLSKPDSECGHPDWTSACVKNNYHGPGYAQKNPHLRDMEKEAYLKGNMCFRDWEDSYKATNYSERGTNMSLKEWKNNELNRLLMKKFGLLKEETNVDEAHCVGRDDKNEEQELEEKKFPDLTGDGKVTQADILKGRGVELDEEEELEEGAGDRGDDDREQGRDAGRSHRADSAGHLEEEIYNQVMKILKGE
tara:strand:+ start:444 stop:1298 length:855 start_codon:yes stop_codon:yes gene_type:complete